MPQLDPEPLDLIFPGFSNRPVIAVLPLEDPGHPPAAEYLGEGLAEDLVMRLASWRDLPVIAPNSSFAYRGNVHICERARELGASHIVAGSVRLEAGEVCLSARLMDAARDEPVWQDRHKGACSELFGFQDQVAQGVIETIEPSIRDQTPERAVPRDPRDFAAWDRAQRGLWHLRRLTKPEVAAARALLEEAAELDPGLVLAVFGVALTHYYDLQYEWTGSVERSVTEVMRLAEIASTLDVRDPRVHFTQAMAHMLSAKREDAIASLELALQLNPSLPLANHLLGFYLTVGGRPGLFPQGPAAEPPRPGDLLVHVRCGNRSFWCAALRGGDRVGAAQHRAPLQLVLLAPRVGGELRPPGA